MIRKTLTYIPSLIVLCFLGLLSFTAVAHAATAVTGSDDVSILDLARPVFEAFSNGQYALMGMLTVLLVVAALKKYLGDAIPFLHSNAGGSLLVLIGSTATAGAAALAAPGGVFSLHLLWMAVLVGVSAAGAYTLLKNLVVDPFLKPLAARAPKWLQPILGLVLWIFDHAGHDDVLPAVVVAEKAGSDAVVASPATGVEGVVGVPTELK